MLGKLLPHAGDEDPSAGMTVRMPALRLWKHVAELYSCPPAGGN